MKYRIEDSIDATENNAWYYYLSKYCIRRMEYSGIGEPPHIERFQDVG
jgi:hypothetical protein